MDDEPGARPLITAAIRLGSSVVINGESCGAVR